jgi:serine/threonine-protein kinase
VEPGRVLADRYEILGPIAEGAMSAVWEGRDVTSGEPVAVKAVSLEQAGWRAEVRDRFQQEARLLTLARHEHLVGVRDIGETDDGYLYLVLDRLSGETLAARLARPPRLGWREAATIALELARGLAALHARGIVHRDLKPANVILHAAGGGAPVSKIIDLGISKVGAAAADPVLFATLTATGQVLGTPAYMSYEQALGERDVDARTDVWALGVVLHEMLSGRLPFEGANVNAVLAAIRRSPPDLSAARGAPPALVRVVERCLTRPRDGRFPDGAALSSAIEAAIALGEREASRARQVRWLAATGGALLVVGGAVALARVALADRAEEPARAATSAPAPPAATSVPASTAPPATTAALGPTAAPPAAAPPSAAAPAKTGRVITRVNSAGF